MKEESKLEIDKEQKIHKTFTKATVHRFRYLFIFVAE